jgi:hypothetical protein
MASKQEMGAIQIVTAWSVKETIDLSGLGWSSTMTARLKQSQLAKVFVTLLLTTSCPDKIMP